MRILITGGTGFVGSHVVSKLSLENFQLALLVRKPVFAETENTSIPLSDPCWKEKVKTFNPDIVIHLASYLTSLDDESSINNLIDSNILFGTNLLDALKGTGCQFFINTGTFAEYENDELSPSYLYAATKTAFRSIISYYQKRNGFKVINVIPYTIYGAKDTKKKLIDLIFDSSSSDKPVDMSPGEQLLDFIHIQDVSDFYQTLVHNIHKIDQDYSEVYLGTCKGTSPRQIAELMDKAGYKPNINWGGISYRQTDTMFAVAKKSDINSLISWDPEISIQEGINLYIKTLNQERGL